jgi:hypothetical protein
MKKLFLILILTSFAHLLHAQQYLFPLSRLMQLYYCKDKKCIDKEVRGYGYTFSRQDSKEMLQEATYTYLNRQLSPYRAEALLSLHTGGMRPSVFFSTNNQSYPAQLQKELRETGFMESAEKSDPKEKKYTLREGDLVWYLTVTETSAANKPALIVGLLSIREPLSAQTTTFANTTNTKTVVAENKNANTTQASPPANRQAPTTALSGSLTYTPHKVERTYYRKNARGETIATARAVFEFPEFNDAGLNALIRRKIVKGSFYEVEAQRVVTDYKESIADMKDDEIPATMSNEYLNVRVTIERDTPRFLLLKNDFNSYGAGAAHGEIGENYWTYDKQKKTLLTLSDLFDYAGLASLHTIAEAAFRKNEKLSPTASLCQGYLFDNCRFALAKEFRLDKNALTFVYNPYEAKSFSQGIWSLSLPYSSIQKLFRPDVWPLIEQHIVGTSRTSTPASGDRTASVPTAKTSTIVSLTEGVVLLFKDTKSKLSNKEKEDIFTQMKFKLSKDKKKFFLINGEDYPFNAGVFIEDLNQDSIEEILIIWGNLHTSGMTGSDVTLFIKDKSGNYQKNLGFEGAGIDILKTKNLGFPDLLIAGRGFCFPVWRWNGRSYQYHRQQCE